MSGARITMEWSDARWDVGVAEELIKEMMDALSDAGRVLPDSITVVRDPE